MWIEGDSENVCKYKTVYKEIYGLEVIQKYLGGDECGAPEQYGYKNQNVIDEVFLMQFDKSSDINIIK